MSPLKCQMLPVCHYFLGLKNNIRKYLRTALGHEISANQKCKVGVTPCPQTSNAMRLELGAVPFPSPPRSCLGSRDSPGPPSGDLMIA
jgi:hypothetical protein